MKTPYDTIFLTLGKIMDTKNKTIEKTKLHIQSIRKNSTVITDNDTRIALGKVLVGLKIAQKNDNQILKQLFKF